MSGFAALEVLVGHLRISIPVAPVPGHAPMLIENEELELLKRRK